MVDDLFRAPAWTYRHVVEEREVQQIDVPLAPLQPIAVARELEGEGMVIGDSEELVVRELGWSARAHVRPDGVGPLDAGIGGVADSLVEPRALGFARLLQA